MGRYAGLYVSRHVGDDIKLGLQRLTNMLAAVPNVDYAVLGKDDPAKAPKLVDVRPRTCWWSAPARSTRDNDQDQQASMKANMEWINARSWTPTAWTPPVRCASSPPSSVAENYTFDVAQPVRKARARPACGAAPLSGLKLAGPGPVRPQRSRPRGDGLVHRPHGRTWTKSATRCAPGR